MDLRSLKFLLVPTFALTLAPGASADFNFASDGYTVIEGGPAISVVVTRTAPLTGIGTVTWATANGTAIAGADFGTAGNAAQRTGALSWAAGTGGSKIITVGLPASNIPVVNDTTQEPARTFNINMAMTEGGAPGLLSFTTVTIEDSDSTIGFLNSNDFADESRGGEVVLVRTGSTLLSQSVSWRTTNGTAMAGSDFGTAGSAVQPYGTITFAPGVTSRSILLDPSPSPVPWIRLIDDGVAEGVETFNVLLSAPTNGAVLGNSATLVNVWSNEPAVSMLVSSRRVSEAAGSIDVGVWRSGTSLGAAMGVGYAIYNGSAQNGTHFVAPAVGTLAWAAGETGPKQIPIAIVNDSAPNAPRTFSVTLTAITAGTPMVAPMTTTVTIDDNDNSVQFSVPVVTVAEGTANLVLTVTRTGATTGTADVSWGAADGTALAGTDFGVLGNPVAPGGTLHWNVGETASKTISIPIINDAFVEGAKTFTVALSTPGGPNLSIGTNSQVLVTINDNDSGIRFSPLSYEGTEGANPSVTLTVIRVGSTATAASATWATVNGSAVSGQDFGAAGNSAPRTGSLSWPAGDATPRSFMIPIINDALGGEGDESFTIVLTPGPGIVLGASGPAAGISPISTGIATVTIHDNDLAPQSEVAFSAPKYLVTEGTPNVVVTVNRNDLGGGFGLPASVSYSMMPGTALATSDYVASSGMLSWAAGLGGARTITIPIVNNAVPEPPESFKVRLTNNSAGLGIATPEATVLIVDEDEVFPIHGIPPGVTPGVADAGWHVSNDPGAYEGVFTLKSDMVDDGQTAETEIQGTFVAGTVAFRVKVSSEPGFDVLRFYVDNVVAGSWSGTAVPGWQVFSMPLSAGYHSLRWSYEKDGSASVGADAAWIDALTTPSFIPPT